MSAAISLRLSDQIVKRLEHLASAADRPKSYLIRQAIEIYLTEYVDYRLAAHRLRDPDDHIISGSELRKKLGL